MTTAPDDELRTRAEARVKARVKAREDFRVHLLVYVLVNAFLWVIWFTTDGPGSSTVPGRCSHRSDGASDWSPTGGPCTA